MTEALRRRRRRTDEVVRDAARCAVNGRIARGGPDASLSKLDLVINCVSSIEEIQAWNAPLRQRRSSTLYYCSMDSVDPIPGNDAFHPLGRVSLRVSSLVELSLLPGMITLVC